MEPITRNANRMLNTLTGKIPEKLSQENNYGPLPTLEELDIANNASSSSSIIESIQNNWLAIVAFLLLLAFTTFNILAYVRTQKTEDNPEDNPEDNKSSTMDSVTKMFNDTYKYGADAISKMSGPEPIVEPKVVPKVVKNQVSGITSGKDVGSNMEEDIDSNAEINTLNSALDNASSKKGDPSYKAHDSYKTVKSKAGWCFIGEEKGFRNCAEVGENDTCLSGDIFPTSQVCINPSLRA